MVVQSQGSRRPVYTECATIARYLCVFTYALKNSIESNSQDIKKKAEKCELNFKYNYSIVSDFSSRTLSSTHTTQGSVGQKPPASPQKPKKYESKKYLLI
jgi:hypothetical protein